MAGRSFVHVACATLPDSQLESELLCGPAASLRENQHRTVLVEQVSGGALLRRVIVFGPLDEEAMTGITRDKNEHMKNLWRQKRKKTIAVPDELVDFIGRHAHELNQKSAGKEGAASSAN